jgi:signal transduction histidine kinase
LPVANLFAGYLWLGAPECLDVFYFTWVGVAIIVLFKLLTPRSLRISRGFASFILILLALVSAVPAVLAGWQHTSDPIIMVILSGSFLTSVGFVLGFAWPASLDEDRIEARNRLEHVNQDLKHELSLFDQQLWLARRQWQFIVHGSVQAALTAALTRLQSPECDQATLALVSQDLQRAEKALMAPPVHKIDLPASLAELQTTWRGICDIRLKITERATRALQGNNDACICVNEIVKEAVSNAVRHGQAKTVTVEIDREGDVSLAIKVSNDGLPIKVRPAAGVGSRLIKELTTSWSLGSSKASGLTVLAASLPLAK